MKETPAVTTKELDEMVVELHELHLAAREAQRAAEKIKAEKLKLQEKILAIMESQDKDRWDVPGCTISLVRKTSVRTPKTVEEKKALAKYLEARGQFWELFGVNSQSLNSYYKNEEAYQRETNGVFDFTLPGCSEPNEYTQLRINSK